jgi:hypothetical protein
MSDPVHLPAVATPRRPWALRALGSVLLLASVGLVSCQALFTL